MVTVVPPAAGPDAGDTPAIEGAATNVKAAARVPLWPSGFVTVTAAVPEPAGVTALIVVLLTTFTAVAALVPTVTVAPTVKPVPVIVMAVPPAAGPDAGATLVTEGGATYVKPAARVALCPSGFVTTTAAGPATPAGVVAVIVLPLTFTFVAAVPPTLTVAPVTKFVPVIVMAVPPAAGPLPGATLVMAGPAI